MVAKKLAAVAETQAEAETIRKQQLTVLENISEAEWTQENIHDKLFALIEQMGVKNGLILWPLRVALSGKERTPGGGIEICAILGKEESLARIRKGIELATQTAVENLLANSKPQSVTNFLHILYIMY